MIIDFNFSSYISLLGDKQRSDDDDDVCLQVALPGTEVNIVSRRFSF